MANEEDEKPDYTAEINQLRSEINALKQQRKEKEDEKKNKKKDSEKYQKGIQALNGVGASLGNLNFSSVGQSIKDGLQGEQGTKFYNEVSNCGVDMSGVASAISAAVTKATDKKKELDDKIKELEEDIKNIDQQIRDKESQISYYQSLM